MKIGIIGAGAFGSALAVAYAKKGLKVALWARHKAHDRDYPPSVSHVDALAALEGAEAILLAIPAQQTAGFLMQHQLPAAPVVLCAKGIDAETGKLQSQIVADAGVGPVSVLTGPGFAAEIAAGLPTALTLAGGNAAQQALLSTSRIRLYRSDDMIGAQAGGALKNVVALACGMAIGAGLGESARAALLTRGFAEMQRLGVALGGRAETFQGLSGLGDLALTCASEQSRNFAQGLAFGRGNGQVGGTVEGLATAQAAAGLAETLGVETPITGAVAAVVSGEATVEAAMHTLLARPLKEE
ncbi:MAG: NAD(P)H-dependent glycerol-3-phosphate dehydrogenase [Rhodobacteraceae bacterium]|nr:NAD(P)H-dependent glycerol-3-phosphate dehydrogenase [Paracoccaceae bacterium]